MTRVVDVINGVEYKRGDLPGCPLCGRPNESRRIPAHFGMAVWVSECQPCRLAYQSPRPSIEASLAYMEMRWQSTDRYVADTPRQRSRAKSQLSLAMTLFDRPGKLLDFGAGIGTFVAVARAHGWEATGIERSFSAVTRCKETHGLDLAPDLRKAPHDLDLVTMWDVVEHLRDPRGTIEELSTHLRPGGWMVLETGNWESGNRLAAGDAWGLYLFDHQYYFTPASLETVTDAAGLDGFHLLNGNEIDAPPTARLGETADGAARREAFRRACELWPEHAGIAIMVAAVQRPTVGASSTFSNA